jgi:hypothetical protein
MRAPGQTRNHGLVGDQAACESAVNDGADQQQAQLQQ